MHESRMGGAREVSIHAPGRSAGAKGLLAKLAACLLLLLLVSRWTWVSAHAGNGVSVIINNVDAQYDPFKDGYDVTAFLTALDAEGLPLLDISMADIEVREDGHQIGSFEIRESEESVNLLLAIDTSGSMSSEGKMDAVKRASALLIQGMSGGDQVGLVSFNASPNLEINLTYDRSGVLNFIDLLVPVRGASTCLWDAAYESVGITASVQEGRRALVLLTDGVDELPGGGSCSSKTLEDVVTLAADPTIRVPTYTVGIGARVNAQDLARLSDLTGGRSFLAVDASSVGDILSQLGDQLRHSYTLRYWTDATSGEHSLFVQLNYQGERDQDTRKFRAPELGGQASFVGIEDHQEVNQDLAISVDVKGTSQASRVDFYVGETLLGEDREEPFETVWRTAGLNPGPYVLRGVVYGEEDQILAVARARVEYKIAEPSPATTASIAIQGITQGQKVTGPIALRATIGDQEIAGRVEFLVDGSSIAVDNVAPFEAQWNTSSVERGEHLLSAVAYGADGQDMARDDVRVVYAPALPLALLIGGAALLMVLAAGSVLGVRRARAMRVPGAGLSADARRAPASGVGGAVSTATPVEVEAMAVLIVEACQDPDLVGHRFEIRSDEVLIGRSPECNVMIPVQPVSRKHALISVGARAKDRFLTMDAIAYEGSPPDRVGSQPRFHIHDGDPMTGEGSTYGTFVDNVRVPEAEWLSISDGSRIRLGRSIAEGRIPPVILLFHDLRGGQHEVGKADLTMDAPVVDRPSPGSRLRAGHEGDLPADKEDQAARTESLPAEREGQDTFATESYDLESGEEEESRSTGEGTDPNVMRDR